MMEDEQKESPEQTVTENPVRESKDETQEVSNRLENLEFVDAEDHEFVSNPAFRSCAPEFGNTESGDNTDVSHKTTLADRLNQDLVEKTDPSQAKNLKDNINSSKVSDSSPVDKEVTITKLAGGDNSSGVDQSPDDEAGSDDEEAYHSAEEGDLVIDEENLREIEETLTEEEKQNRREEAQSLKETGNGLFKEACYKEAIKAYGKALQLCPLAYAKDRSIMYSNRAACQMRSENFEDAISDSTKALELNPNYLKALLRRAELYEKTEKLDEALADYTKIVEMDPSQHVARAACVRLPDQIKERNEKMKEEMMGKLKDLGNMILKPFGLSTNNFQLQQDPNTGGYSVQFNNNGK